MSGFFVDRSDLVRITFEDGPLAGNHLMVRAELSHVELQRLAIAGVGAEIEDGKVRPVLAGDALTDMDVRKLEAWVKSWTLPKRGNAQVGPEWRPTLSDFEALPPRIMRPILEKLAEHEERVLQEAEPVAGPLDSEVRTLETFPASVGSTGELSGSTGS